MVKGFEKEGGCLMPEGQAYRSQGGAAAWGQPLSAPDMKPVM